MRSSTSINGASPHLGSAEEGADREWRWFFYECRSFSTDASKVTSRGHTGLLVRRPMINWNNKKMHPDISESVIQIPLLLFVNLARAKKLNNLSAKTCEKVPERIGSTSRIPRLHSEKRQWRRANLHCAIPTARGKKPSFAKLTTSRTKISPTPLFINTASEPRDK